ncbi:23S rRNA (guanosine(2251)-2'-O)-methyltransferase RlmB, partial [Schumannella luteola]
MAKPGRPGARKNKKGATAGTGGHGRKALEGKGPTPKAEDRSWHVAGKRKAANDRLEAARARHGKPDASGKRPPRPKKADDGELVTGRNSVVEALRARIPASTLYVAARVEMDDRVKEALSIATKRGIPVLEVMRPELDRMSGPDA